MCKKNNYSIIHSFKDFDSWPFFKAAKENGIKNRILHRNVNPTKPNQPIIKILESKNRRLSIKYSSKLIGVSNACCKNAFHNREYTVLYNSYNESKYNMDVSNNLLDDELVITETASYSENKNQLFALQVLRELKKLHNNSKLNLVGATDMDSYYKKLIDYSRSNDLDNNVSFIKRSESVEEIYKSTTFIVVPSLREGFSLVTVEAQACGIIAFASTNVTNEVDCGGVRFLDLSKGPAYWAEKIYSEFIKQGNKRTKYDVDKFSFDKFMKQLIDFYE